MTKVNNMPQAETRGLPQSTMELREEDDGKRTLRGYALKWEMKSNPLGYMGEFKEQFKRGAFTETLTSNDQRALWSHDTSKVLGRTGNGTLRLFEDDIGLRFELDLPNTTLGTDTYETIKRGDVEGVSFGFIPRKQEWDETEETVIRSITDAELLEISPVAWPAYPDSGVMARSNDPYQKFMEQQEARERLILETYL